MNPAVTEVPRDGYMGRLTSIRTLQLLADLDDLTTAAKRCCVSPHAFPPLALRPPTESEPPGTPACF